MLKVVIDLINDILQNFISDVKTQKCIGYRKALQKIFAHFGYGFESPIEELDKYVYCPSNNGTASIQGIPRPEDFGYNCDAFLSLLMRQFNARIVELDGVIHFRTQSDPFWLKNSSYVMDDILLEDRYREKINTDEMVKSRIVRYVLDNSDDWTLDNYKGTNYAIYVDHINKVDNRKDGLDDYIETVFPVSLGNRKDTLSNLERSLKVLASVADTVTGLFGSNQQYAQRIKNRVGMLKVSGETWTLPKCLYIEGETMPFGHRGLTSAKFLWDKYINEKSLVSNDFKRQRVFYTGVEVGFGLDNYIEVNRNSYFTTPSGKIGKFVNVKWNFNKDRAIVDFWIQEIHSDKLKEIFIETE